ncbi:MAG: ABC transporter ATP-binding protein [Actinobacteria bacterium]|nr:ABC transporter ATP-binding protein [Actinomycetota bacterium]
MSTAPRPDGPGGVGGRLRAAGIKVQFQGLTAIDDVSCDLYPGEIVGLIGPNGAGKTTFVNVLSGFQEATEGSVAVDDTEIGDLSPEARAKLGVVRTFQGARLFTNLTVIENAEVSGVGIGLKRGAARQRAVEMLEAVGMTELAGARAGDITTGQERRLQVARAMAMEPRYLFLDEPAAGLNEEETDELIEVIEQLPRRLGCGVLLIEHDMRVIMGSCDRIVVLDQGKVIKVGTPAEVRSDQRVIDAYLGS